MKWTPWLIGSLTVAVIAGCGGDRRDNDTGAATVSDTAVPDNTGATGGLSSDTAHVDAEDHGDMHNPSSGASDSAKGNQTKSGVTNTETGKSTLGKGVTTTRPDQSQPVTAKGDTVSGGADSTGGANQ
jgi:hypothetical protein